MQLVGHGEARSAAEERGLTDPEDFRRAALVINGQVTVFVSSAFAPLTRAAAEALEPLELALSDRRACERLLARVGRHVTVSPDTLERVRELLPLADLLESLDPDAEPAQVVEAVAEAVNAIRGLAELDPAELEGLPGSLSDPAGWADLAAALPDVLLAGWLSSNQPALHALMRLTGICALENSGRTTRERFRWDALGATLGDPAAALRETVGWESEFAAWPLQRELGLALGRMGLPVRVRPRSRPVAEALAGEAVEVPTGVESDVVLFSGANGDGAVEAGLIFACSTDDGPTVYVGNQAYGELEAPLALSDAWTLRASGNIEGSGSRRCAPAPIGLELVGGSAALGTSLALEGRPPGGPWNLLGDGDGTRVELDGVTIELGLAGTASEPEAYLLARVDDGGLRIALDLGGADSFLRGALGEGPVIEAGGQLRFGSRSGLAFEGGLGLSVTLPVERQVGPFYIASVTIELGASGDGVRFAATTVADVTLGPVVGSVTDVGAALLLAPDAGGDGLAGLAGALEFVPPTASASAWTSRASSAAAGSSTSTRRSAATPAWASWTCSASASSRPACSRPGSRAHSRLVDVPEPGRAVHRRPARLRLHAQRRRRARRDRPRPRRGRARRGRALRVARRDPVPRERDRGRRADPGGDRRDLPLGGRPVRVRPDGEDRLGHADAGRARRGGGDPAAGPADGVAARRARARCCRARTRRSSSCTSTSRARSTSPRARSRSTRR